MAADDGLGGAAVEGQAHQLVGRFAFAVPLPHADEEPVAEGQVGVAVAGG